MANQNSTEEINDCLFCSIASKKIESIIISETEESIAFLDIKPAQKGHVVLIPKNHVQIMPQMDDNTMAHFYKHAQQISHAIISGLTDLGVSGTTILINQGQVAGQRASHLMMHIIPRTDNDKLFQWSMFKEDEAKIYEFASLIKSKISSSKADNSNVSNANDTNVNSKADRNEDIDLDQLTKTFGG
jgi:histidine triad (HIT) family protein